MKASIEVIQTSIADDTFASLVRAVNDDLDSGFSSVLHSSTSDHTAEAS